MFKDKDIKGFFLEIFRKFSELLDIIDCRNEYFLVEKVTFYRCPKCNLEL